MCLYHCRTTRQHFMSLSSLLISGTWLSELRNTVAWASLVSFLWYRKKWDPVLLQLQSSTGIWPFHTGAGTLTKPLPNSAKQHGLINNHKMVQSFLHTKFPPVISSSQDQLTIQDWIAAEKFSWKNGNIDRIRHFEELLQSTRDDAQWIQSPVTVWSLHVRYCQKTIHKLRRYWPLYSSFLRLHIFDR